MNTIILDHSSVAELAEMIADKLALKLKKPSLPVCSQREAYARFGTGNVRRWKKEGKLKPFAKRPGKTEYKISELTELFNQEQDYFNSNVHVQSQKKRV